jgi:hypothetical protein
LPVTPKAQVASANAATKENGKPATDWWLVVFTGALVVVAVLQWFAMRQQAAAGHQQSGYMRDSLGETRRAADAAAAGAAAAKLAAEAAKTSAEAAQESNKIAEQSVELANRAWVIMTGADAPTKFTPGEPWRIKTTMRNSGGVPATNVVAKHAYAVIPSDAPLSDEEPAAYGEEFFAVVPVGRPAKGVAIFPGLSEQEVNGIENGDSALFFFCRIDYTDTFKKPRWSIACMRYDLQIGDWVVAQKHNHAE